jgi:hypothetical protein
MDPQLCLREIPVLGKILDMFSFLFKMGFVRSQNVDPMDILTIGAKPHPSSPPRRLNAIP